MGLECKTFQLDVPVWVSKMEGAMWLAALALIAGFILGKFDAFRRIVKFRAHLSPMQREEFDSFLRATGGGWRL